MATALTYDQVLAALASTGQRTITGPVMQNVVESLVHPLTGGGMPGAQAGEVSLFRIDSSMTPVAQDSYAPYRVYGSPDPAETHVWDPLGIRRTDVPYVSTSQGDTWPAGSWFEIDQGQYVWKMGVVWTASDVGNRLAGLLPIDNRDYAPTPPVYDHVFWGPAQWDMLYLKGPVERASSIVSLAGSMFQTTAGLFRVTEAMGPSAFGAIINQDAQATLALSSGVLFIWRLGDCNVDPE